MSQELAFHITVILTISVLILAIGIYQGVYATTTDSKAQHSYKIF